MVLNKKDREGDRGLFLVSVILVYFYDETGTPIGMAYRNADTVDENATHANQFDLYLFTKNLQGDIVGIYDVNATLVASYVYDAWGNHTVTNYTSENIGNINPFRYRGYYFDSETGFYYLNTRYYNPQLKRFINADSLNYLGANGDMQAFNLYAYCSNNPVMFVDTNGNVILAILGLIIVDTAIETTVLMNSEKYSAENVFDEENQSVEIPNSYLFNNPIAQHIYSNYLYENVKYENGENFFTGDVYDIIGEWQMHNVAFWAPVVFATSGDLITTGAGIMIAHSTHGPAKNANIGSSVEKENNGLRKYVVYYPSQLLKWANKIGTLDILNWER